MPPKMKVRRAEVCHKNPRVILRPLLADFSIQNRYRFSSPPASASLYNKPDLSDIKLKVGTDTYYAHKLILSAASDVFSRMLNSDWLESRSEVLELQEEEECIKVFDLFLFFLYTGSIVLSEAYIVPLYMLADKYEVKLLYEECVKVIKKGLKVFVADKSGSLPPASGPVQTLGNVDRSFAIASMSSSSADSPGEELSDSDASQDNNVALDDCTNSRPSSADEEPGTSASVCEFPSKSSSKTVLVASETFSLNLVMRLIMTCHNESISNAAMYNMEVRLGNQISLGIFATWNELDQRFLAQVLADRFFYCKEFLLFQAVKSWFEFDPKRQTEEVIADLMQHIRFPLLRPSQLYQVEQDVFASKSSTVKALIQEGIRYQLFKSCCHDGDRLRWTGPQFEERVIRRP